MSSAPRIAFVVGKGGVGKTTVATLLARRAQKRGARVLFVSLAHRSSETAIAREALAGVEMIAVDGASALDEYLAHRLRPHALHRFIVESSLYRRFVAVAPGLKELMALGKICDEERQRTGDRPTWDAIVVDAPASGHALELLAMPKSALAAFGPGLVRFEVERMLGALRDPVRAQIFFVTLPEEMPLAECAELITSVRRLRMSIGGVFINRVRRCPVEKRALEVRAPLSEDACAMLACARIEASWAAAHRVRLSRVHREWSVPIIELPFLGRGELSLSALDELERALAEAA